MFIWSISYKFSDSGANWLVGLIATLFLWEVSGCADVTILLLKNKQFMDSNKTLNSLSENLISEKVLAT